MAGTNLVTDAKTLIANGPSVATAANAVSGTLVVSGGIQGGAPVDYVGMLQLYLDALKSLNLLLTNLKAVTDSGDPNLTYINADLATLT